METKEITDIQLATGFIFETEPPVAKAIFIYSDGTVTEWYITEAKFNEFNRSRTAK